MKDIEKIKGQIEEGELDQIFLSLYCDESCIEKQRKRYVKAVEKFEYFYGRKAIEIYSAPGRTEIGGNHTDHQNGRVLASSINLDAIAIVTKTDESVVRIVSEGYPDVSIDILMLEPQEDEKGKSQALIRGIAANLKKRGYKIGGFNAVVTSEVLSGSGLSSSAAYEVLVGLIFSGLYNESKVDPVVIAQIGQEAEREYFGKPCGLMDQMACSLGSLVYIDFADKKMPQNEIVPCDLTDYGYSLCITDTKGSHEDLTDDYAAVPEEMRAAADVFGKEVLCGITLEALIEKAPEVRIKAGDRAFLRAIHFVNENARVQQEVSALKAGDFVKFLSLVKASGESSFKFLQNVYVNHHIQQQNVSVALAISEVILGENGVCRVHGGGFAGTIQAFVKNEAVVEYKVAMEKIFGENTCKVLKIRKYGGMKVV